MKGKINSLDATFKKKSVYQKKNVRGNTVLLIIKKLAKSGKAKKITKKPKRNKIKRPIKYQ